MRFRFDDFEVDADRFELRRNGEPLRVEPLVFDLICYLARNPGRIVGRDEVIEHVWKGRIVSDATIASAVNGASAGMMFSVPAIFILGYTDFNIPLLVISCIAGGILGIAFIIPLRKQMIDYNRLAYPGGIAVATILKSPGAGIRKAWYLVGGAIISAI